MNRKAGVLLLSLAVAGLAGCSNKTSPVGSGESLDQLGVQSSMATMPEIMNDGLADDVSATGFSSRGASGPLAVPGPEYTPGGPNEGGSTPVERNYHRVITSVDRSFSFEFSDPDSQNRPRAAHVTVTKILTGSFVVVSPETLQDVNGQDSVVARRVQKPLSDRWVRHLWLTRYPRLEGHADARHGWRLTAASGVEVTSQTSDEGAQPHIQSIRLQVGESDVTFSDPAVAIHWLDLWHAPGAPVSVTVTTDRADDVVVLQHKDGRVLLAPQGDNTYTGTWNTPAEGGLKHFGVNALSRATLFDDEAGYHSHAWLFPYLNQGESVADDTE